MKDMLPEEKAIFSRIWEAPLSYQGRPVSLTVRNSLVGYVAARCLGVPHGSCSVPTERKYKRLLALLQLTEAVNDLEKKLRSRRGGVRLDWETGTLVPATKHHPLPA